MCVTPAGPDPSWGDPPRRSAPDGAPVLAAAGFEGPLDWLLELARAGRIDLRQLSILQLVEAFAAALQAGLVMRGRADLSRWGEWLGMAAQLALLRSRLLLPAEAAEARSAREVAEALRRRMLDRVATQRAAAWLDGRLQLERDVFARGVAEASRTARVADVADLFRACLVVLRVPDLAKAYTPARPPLWRVVDASERITRLLSEGVAGEIALFLPPVPAGGPERELRCRAALASTLMAGLELARSGAIRVSQAQPKERITVELPHIPSHNRGMERDHSQAPAEWIDALARADDDIAHNRTASVDEVLDELHAQLAELEAEMNAEPETPAVNAPGR